jgi:hypothetical protein
MVDNFSKTEVNTISSDRVPVPPAGILVPSLAGAVWLQAARVSVRVMALVAKFAVRRKTDGMLRARRSGDEGRVVLLYLTDYPPDRPHRR